MALSIEDVAEAIRSTYALLFPDGWQMVPGQSSSTIHSALSVALGSTILLAYYVPPVNVTARPELDPVLRLALAAIPGLDRFVAADQQSFVKKILKAVENHKAVFRQTLHALFGRPEHRDAIAACMARLTPVFGQADLRAMEQLMAVICPDGVAESTLWSASDPRAKGLSAFFVLPEDPDQRRTHTRRIEELVYASAWDLLSSYASQSQRPDSSLELVLQLPAYPDLRGSTVHARGASVQAFWGKTDRGPFVLPLVPSKDLRRISQQDVAPALAEGGSGTQSRTAADAAATEASASNAATAAAAQPAAEPPTLDALITQCDSVDLGMDAATMLQFVRVVAAALDEIYSYPTSEGRRRGEAAHQLNLRRAFGEYDGSDSDDTRRLFRELGRSLVYMAAKGTQGISRRSQMNRLGSEKQISALTMFVAHYNPADEGATLTRYASMFEPDGTRRAALLAPPPPFPVTVGRVVTPRQALAMEEADLRRRYNTDSADEDPVPTYFRDDPRPAAAANEHGRLRHGPQPRSQPQPRSSTAAARPAPFRHDPPSQRRRLVDSDDEDVIIFRPLPREATPAARRSRPVDAGDQTPSSRRARGVPSSTSSSVNAHGQSEGRYRPETGAAGVSQRGRTRAGSQADPHVLSDTD